MELLTKQSKNGTYSLYKINNRRYEVIFSYLNDFKLPDCEIHLFDSKIKALNFFNYA